MTYSVKRYFFLLLLAFTAGSVQALDIGGYQIIQSNALKTYTFATGTTAHPGDYIVMGRSASQTQFESYWGVSLATNVTYINASNTFPKIDGSERFVLRNSSSVGIDGPTPSSLNPLSKSIQRKSATNDASSSSSWTALSYSSATPGSGCAGVTSNGLVISEYSDAGSFQYEFVELYCSAAGAASNLPPVLQEIPGRTVTISNALQFDVSATPTDTNTVTLSVSNAPAGSSFYSTNENGTFVWTSPSPLGVYTMVFYAANLHGTDSKTVTVSVLEPPTVRFAASEYFASEDVGTQQVQVVLSRAADATVQMAIAGTATTNDFSLSSTTVVFSASGSTQATIGVIITNDSVSESTETVILTLTHPSSASVGSIPQSTVYIRDNDAIAIMSANLVTGSDSKYYDPGTRIMRGLKPDIVGIQEWNITNASYRNFVDVNFGTNFSYYIEPQATNYFPIPNGIISRWPIKASGEWSDPVVMTRDFAWATIDIPGDRDLHVVCVHLYSSGTDTDREDEARYITNYIAGAGWPSNDYLVICGDLNLTARTNLAMLVLTNLVSDSHKPADQNGDTDSNSSRTKPFDYVLPGPSLDSNTWPVIVGSITFTNGIVFDSRLWTNGTPPPSPILTNDSDAVNADHMAIMKAFSLGKTPPALQSVGAQRVFVGNSLQFTVSATPTDGDTYTLIASNLPPGATFLTTTNTTGTFTWNNASPVGVYTTIFYAVDTDGVESESVILRVLVDGEIWINELHYDNASTDTNEGVEIAGTAGVDLSLYSLCTYDGAAGTVERTNLLSGTIDDEGCGYGAVWVPIANLENGPDGVALVECETNVVQFFSYEGTIVAVDGPAVELSSTDIGVSEAGTEAVGKSLQLTGSGTNYEAFTWAGPTNAASRGYLNSLQTIYPCGGSSNQSPVLFAIGNQSATLSNLLTFSVTASDIDNDAITLSVSNAPAGASFNSTNGNGTFLWTTPSPIGVYTTSFYAADDDGVDSETITITVASGTEPPVLQTIGNKTVITGRPLSFSVTATDAEGDAITLTESNAPAGSTFSSTNGDGYFVWTNPTPVGVHTTKFYAADDDGIDSATVKITVTAATNLPVIATIDSPWTFDGSLLQFNVTATDPDADTITLSISNAPADSTFVADGGTGTFTWTNASPVGVYTSFVYATDNDGTVSQAVVLRVFLNGQVWINELHYDNASTDTNEGVEIAGTAGVDLSLYSIYTYNGADGKSGSSTHLTGLIDDEGCGYGAVWVPIAGLENGPDGVALILDNSNLVEFLSYEGSFTASNGPANGSVSLDIKVKEFGTETNKSLQLMGYGTNAYDFSWAGSSNTASPGVLNALQTIYPCGSDTNQPPLLYSIGDRIITENVPISFTVTAVDFNHDAITLSVSNAPAGSTFSSTETNGTFTWTDPTPVGIYTMTFYAADSTGADSETIRLTVSSSLTNPPTIAALSSKTVTESNTLSFAVVATEPDGDTITLSVSNAPAGSVFSSTNGNGTFTWANAAPVGVYTTSFYAVDKDGFDAKSVTLTVQAYTPVGSNSLVLYDFENGSGGFTNTPANAHSNITASSYAPNDGTYADVAGNPSTGRAISDSGWNTTSHYYSFSFTIATGYQAHLNGLQFNSYRSSTGPSNWVLRYSGDTYSADLGIGDTGTASLWSTNHCSLTLSGLTGAITLRLYGANASSSSGTWRQDNVELLGTIEPVPNNDSDGDGLPNEWEIQYFGDSTSAMPAADSDADGMNNEQEYIAGTVPTNSRSLFEIEALWTNMGWSVQFNSTTNRLYGLYYATNLLEARWLPWVTNLVGSNISMTIVVTNGPDTSFFRPGVKLP